MPASRPNILLVLTDQQRADTVGAGGNPVIRTPTMDRLCAEGALFANAYTPSPVCIPARCSLIFGQYPHKTGCYDNGQRMPEVTEDRPTFMSALAQAGYQTHGVGKMHFTPDRHALRGFESRARSEELPGTVEEDHYLTWLHSQGFEHVHDPHGVRGEMYYIPQPSQLPARAQNTTWVADQSIEFLKGRDRSRPFLLFASFIDPHPPFAPPTPWNKLYRAPSMPLPKRPPQCRNLWTYMNHVQNRYKYRDAGIDDNLLRTLKAYYYATVSFIDYNVGRILQALEEQGQLDTTLVAWTSDHGEFLGDYDCFGKRSFLDPAARIPLIVLYRERFSPRTQVSALASSVDLMPTILSAAGLDTADMDLDGLDLAELVGNPQSRKFIWGQYAQESRANYMALSDRFKYVYSAPDRREFLFDRLVDFEEPRNRAETVGYAPHTQAMRDALIRLFRDEGYHEPLDGDGWRLYPVPELPKDPDAGLLFQDAPWAEPYLHIPGYSDEDEPSAKENP